MQIKETAIDILAQLEDLIVHLDDNQYCKPLECLMENSLGKHLRHILEFYDLMISGNNSGIVNYDKRSHDKSLEENRKLAVEKIRQFKTQIESIETDKSLILETSYLLNEDTVERVDSSYMREMVYNIEHAIHHMAIMKIGIRQAFPDIKLDDNFGIAYSTVKFMNKECAQ